MYKFLLIFSTSILILSTCLFVHTQEYIFVQEKKIIQKQNVNNLNINVIKDNLQKINKQEKIYNELENKYANEIKEYKRWKKMLEKINAAI